MGLPPSWQAWLEEVGAARVVCAPDDILEEANGNLWHLEAPPEPGPLPEVAQVEALVRSVVEARRRQLRETGGGPMRIYWWHDDLAGQLRFSLVSSSHRRLPFACKIEPAPALGEILSGWLASPWLRGIPLSSLSVRESSEDSDTGDPEPETPYVLQVWSAEVP